MSFQLELKVSIVCTSSSPTLITCKENGTCRVSVCLPEIFYAFFSVLYILNGASEKEFQAQESCCTTKHCGKCYSSWPYENIILCI